MVFILELSRPKDNLPLGLFISPLTQRWKEYKIKTALRKMYEDFN